MAGTAAAAKPLVAIVGRPNVGKSTFFNKIVGHRVSIVEDTPGVTRDRIYEDTEWNGRRFTLIDTGGIDPGSGDELLSQMRFQAQIAMDDADVICFFTDARTGLTPDDEDVAVMLRHTGKPVILAVNKTDHPGLMNDTYEFYALGLGDPVCISAANMLGLGDLLDAIVSKLPPAPEEEADEGEVIRLAVVGRPNVGKSSLVNRLLGEPRSMVSDIPGTTRDAIDAPLTDEDGTVFHLIDTAGIRRKGVIEDGTIERYSVIRSLNAIRRCDVALLLIDAAEGVTEQDAHIAGIIRNEGKAAVVLVNKWDSVEKETGTLEKNRREVLEALKFMDYARTLYISALTGQRTNQVLREAKAAYEQYSRRVPTGALNDVLGDAQMAVQPPVSGGRRLRIYYATQPLTCPPTFALFVNDEKLMHFSYQRYLENVLRKSFGFEGTPLVFELREKSRNDPA